MGGADPSTWISLPAEYCKDLIAGYEAGKKAAQVKVKYITQAKFWRYNDGASVVNPTLTKGSDGVWIFDISQWTTNSAGAGTPTGWSTTYSDVTTLS